MTRARRVREHLATLLAPTDQPADQDPGGGTPNEAIPPDLLAQLDGPSMVSADGRNVPHPELAAPGRVVLPGGMVLDVLPRGGNHSAAGLQRAVEHAQSIAEAMRQATTNQLDHPRDPHDYARQMDSLIQQLGHALTPGPA